MHYHRIPNSDLTVSAVCQGAMPFGTSISGEALERLLLTFREAGGNFFDTAHCYCFWREDGLGASERALGALLRTHGREGMVIASKGGHPSAGDGYARPDRYLSPTVVAQDVDDSLSRLGVDCIDLYYLHRDDPREPAGAVIETLNAEIRRGGIRYLGASNWTAARIAEANAYAAAHGLHGFVASQPQWSLAQRNSRTDDDPTMRFLQPEDVRWHAESGLPVIPYAPTANGYFATGGQAAAGAFDNPVSRARMARAGELAAQLGATVNQVALAYLLGQDFLTIPILGTTKVDHLADALGAVDIRLTAAQVRWLAEGDAIA